jgi:hypothetical protein
VIACERLPMKQPVARTVPVVASLVFGGILLSAQPTEIPNWWFSADSKAVMSDPLFPNLPLSTRREILSQIDSKFAKMKGDKQDAFLWNAETAYLPRAATPRQTLPRSRMIWPPPHASWIGVAALQKQSESRASWFKHPCKDPMSVSLRHTVGLPMKRPSVNAD